jgi:AbiTii
MSTPLILQIQQAAMDRNSPLTDALTKAKVACAKVGLTEFGEWVDRELDGYMDMSVKDLPPYPRLRGVPEGFNPYHGWSAITFRTGEQEASWGDAPIRLSVPSIEASLSPAQPSGRFYFPYLAEAKRYLLENVQGADDVRIRLEVPQVVGLLQRTKSILLEWTLEIEKQGVLGENMLFSLQERANSVGPTSQAVHNVYNIENVGTEPLAPRVDFRGPKIAG